MRKIALFGTSADPPTTGHQAILQWLSSHFDDVAVWASDNPFKSHTTSLGHRMKMLRLLITETNILHSNIKVREELSSPRSLEAVKKARETWGKDNEFFLVVGSDIIGQIPSWYKSQELLETVQLLIVPRPGYEIQSHHLQGLQQLGGKYAIADLEVPAVSSTAYRERGNSDVIPQPIEDYIFQEKLYSCQDKGQT